MKDTWLKDPQRIQRARIVLVLFLSKKSKGELVELIMSWLEDSAIQGFCEKVMGQSDLDYIEGRRGTGGTGKRFRILHWLRRR